jgi:hypothetical protein
MGFIQVYFKQLSFKQPMNIAKATKFNLLQSRAGKHLCITYISSFHVFISQ